MMVRCVKNITNDKLKAENITTEGRWSYVRGGLADLNRFKPIYYLDANSRQGRHQQLSQIVLEDEAKYGTNYDFTNANS
jgi:hypothetical protein